tara:strand:- start:607 stop:1770 length:1164 start_codon:yes stop_codon:yes gene_type:complete
MLIAFLGYNSKKTKLINFLKSKGNRVVYFHGNKKLCLKKYDLVISFGYKKKISHTTLKELKRPAINLHISYLPHNRGSHPNFWSFVNNTPKGVTIHEINKNIDEGKIIFQKKIKFSKKHDDFKKTYEYLKYSIEKLFIKNYIKIIKQKYKSTTQNKRGSLHYKKEIPKWQKNWKLKIKDSIIKHEKEKNIKKNNYDIIVVLSKNLNNKGKVTNQSKNRLKLASYIYYLLNKEPTIFVMGWKYKKIHKITLAKAYEKCLIENFLINKKSIFQNKIPRDTVGEAIVSFLKIKKLANIKKICVITDQYHCCRAKKIFEFIYDKKYKIYFECVNMRSNNKIQMKEKKSIETFEKTFKGIKKGDIKGIIKRIQLKHPYYNGVKFKEVNFNVF